MISHGTPAKVGIVSYTSKEDIDALGIQQFGFKGWQHAGVGTPTGNDFGWSELLCLSLLSHGRLSDIRLKGQDRGRDQTASISDCLQVPAFLYPLCHIFQLNYMPFLPSPRFYHHF
jgi:hypothetical protein